MFRKLIFIFSVIFLKINCSDLKYASLVSSYSQNAENWANSHIAGKKLDQQMIRVLANYLGASHYIANQNFEILSKTKQVLKSSWELKQKGMNSNFNKNLSDIKSNANQINKLMSNRQMAQNSMKQYLSILKSTNDKDIKEAFECVTKNVQNLIKQSLSEENKKIKEVMSSSKIKLTQSVNNLKIMVKAYETLVDRNFSFRSIPGVENIFKLSDGPKKSNLPTQDSWLLLMADDQIFEFYRLTNELTKLANKLFHNSIIKAANISDFASIF